jgi:hypothetical protein
MAVAAAAALSIASSAFAQLWDNSAQGNGVLITHPAGMTGTVAGQDRSAISPGGTLFGTGGAQTANLRLADNFTVPAGPGWNVSSIQVFGYLTGATAPGATGVTMRIWQGGPPGTGSVLFGDTTTNLLSSTGWAVGPNGGIYRTLNTDTLGATRRVQEITANVNWTLSPGTYWLDFAYTGISFTPVLSSTTTIPPGNAIQSQDGGATFAFQVLDGGIQVDLPFIINGTVVPEPTSLALIGLGGLALLARRRNA